VWGKDEKFTCNFFTTPLKIWWRKTSDFAELPPTHHQSEAHNFETAQHIDKLKPDVSSTISAQKWYQIWGEN